MDKEEKLEDAVCENERLFADITIQLNNILARLDNHPKANIVAIHVDQAINALYEFNGVNRPQDVFDKLYKTIDDAKE